MGVPVRQPAHDSRDGIDEELASALRADAHQEVGPIDVRLMDRKKVMAVRASHPQGILGIGLQPDELQGETARRHRRNLPEKRCAGQPIREWAACYGRPSRFARRADPTCSDRVAPARHHTAGLYGAISMGVGSAPTLMSKSASDVTPSRSTSTVTDDPRLRVRWICKAQGIETQEPCRI
jgi:hypothetical protein